MVVSRSIPYNCKGNQRPSWLLMSFQSSLCSVSFVFSDILLKIPFYQIHMNVHDNKSNSNLSEFCHLEFSYDHDIATVHGELSFVDFVGYPCAHEHVTCSK